jgi:hypothetical protein
VLIFSYLRRLPPRCASSKSNENTPENARIWMSYRNLTQRPSKPALNRGRIQRQALRALWASPDGIVTTAEAAGWAYAKKTILWKQRLTPSEYRLVRRALERVADRIGFGAGSARPILWKLRDDPDADLTLRKK